MGVHLVLVYSVATQHVLGPKATDMNPGTRAVLWPLMSWSHSQTAMGVLERIQNYPACFEIWIDLAQEILLLWQWNPCTHWSPCR